MRVFVAIWSHQYGEDINVFDSESKAEAWRQKIANDEWDNEMEGKTPPVTNAAMADEYFHSMELRWSKSEFFNVHECEVQ